MSIITVIMDRALFEKKRAEAERNGFNLIGDAGTTPSYQGVTLDYSYVEPTLTVTIHANPLVRFLAEKRVRVWLSS